jgi:uncharacterized protein YgbK (DUF1537 family)
LFFSVCLPAILIRNPQSSIRNRIMPIQLLILADDLTGSADTAAQFVRSGIAAAVALGDDPPFALPRLEVLSVDTETRHVPPLVAFRRVASVVQAARNAGINRFYKKIDSTFRGNVGAELEALIQAASADQLFLVPAFPRGGRITREGNQYVHGVPLHESAFNRDPLEPMTGSYIPSIIGRQTKFPVHCIDRVAFESFDIQNERRSGIFCFDAETDCDLLAIGERFAAGDGLRIMAGSAGFAAILPQVLPLKKSSIALPEYYERLLVVNGSLNEVSVAQVAAARQRDMFCAYLHPDEVESTVRGNDGAIRALVEPIVRHLNAEGRALFSSPAKPFDGLSPATCATVLGHITAAVLEQVPDLNLAVFGGDTAFAVCKAIDAGILHPALEIEPGCTVCSSGRPGAKGAVIVKSGGFGSKNIVAAIETYISTGSKGRG